MNLEDLGRRAVACKHWRWMPGMLLLWKLHERGGTYCGRVCHLGSSDSGTGKDVYCEGRGDRFDGVLEVPNCFPDLSDPATLGCLLALVRAAWPHEWHKFMVPIFDGISHWYMGCLMPGTSRIVMPTRVMQNGLLDALPPKSTEAEALVAALEAAP